MAEIIGIDLGTSSTRIYVKSKKAVIFDEPTCLSIDIKTDQIVNIGYLAFKSLKKENVERCKFLCISTEPNDKCRKECIDRCLQKDRS